MVGPSQASRTATLDAMTDSIAHRGPDDRGVWSTSFRASGTDYSVDLGHRRLSIIDLSALGHQPMTSGDGTVTIVYNGEIYNFRELRSELEALGATFRSSCDTEVVIAAWQAWGLDSFSRLNGMFALALWDATRSQLVLARDHLGIKPLYYRADGDRIAFASELKALRVLPDFRLEIDQAALALYLRHGYVAGPRTIWRGVRKLEPGCHLSWRPGEVREGRFFDVTSGPEEPPARSLRNATDRLEVLLGDSVERQLVSDVPIGAFLSGGIDSSAVVAMMRERASAGVRTFTIGFDDEVFDEAPYARAVASHLGTDHVELYVSSDEALQVALDLPDLYDEPFADASAIPTVLLSRLTRERVTVALSGDGGDELFGGYDSHGRYRQLDRLFHGLGPLRHVAAKLGRRLPASVARTALLHMEARDPAELALRVLSAYREGGLEAMCGSNAAENAVFLQTFRDAPAHEDVRRMMYADARVYLPDDILTKVDIASMSVSLEVRVPILDPQLVRFGLSLPLDVIWAGGQTKAPLRELAYRRIPRKLLDRPKRGFGIPLHRLLSARIDAWTSHYLSEARLAEEGLLRPAGVSAVVRQAMRLSDPLHRYGSLWRLVCFERWFARHVRKEASIL